MIELGADRGAPEPPRRRPTSRRWRVAGALLACALLGAAAPPAPLPVSSGPPLPPRAALLAAGTLVLTVDPDADPPVLTAYDADAPRLPARWRVPVTPAAGWSAEPAGELLLVAERDPVRQVVATTARSARTGEPRWRRDDRVYAAGDGAVAVTEVRSVTDPGRRVEGAVRGVDVTDGATRWSVPLPSTAVLAVLPGTPGRVLVLRDDGLARVYDVRDGTVRGEGRLPPADYAPDNPQVVGAYVVLRHPVAGGAELVGYDLPGLVPRWRVPVDRETTVQPCAGLLCGQDGRDRWALVPAGGARAWTWPGGAGWRAVPGSGDVRPLLRAADRDGRRHLVSTVGPHGPRVVGVLPAGVRDCRAAGAVLMCRDADGRLAAWSIRG
ncbi:hypothetical protein AB0J20_17605 [Micromonospora costi]|uniref:hypothetical protein n=1 Tax=Micromonospora costi TaxID=1530042 RepID=UPI0033FBAD37